MSPHSQRHSFHSPHLRREAALPDVVWTFTHERDEYSARADTLTEGTRLIEFVRASDGWHGYAAAPPDMPIDQASVDYAHLRLMLGALLGRS